MGQLLDFVFYPSRGKDIGHPTDLTIQDCLIRSCVEQPPMSKYGSTGFDTLISDQPRRMGVRDASGESK